MWVIALESRLTDDITGISTPAGSCPSPIPSRAGAHPVGRQAFAIELRTLVAGLRAVSPCPVPRRRLRLTTSGQPEGRDSAGRVALGAEMKQYRVARTGCLLRGAWHRRSDWLSVRMTFAWLTVEVALALQTRAAADRSVATDHSEPVGVWSRFRSAGRARS